MKSMKRLNSTLKDYLLLHFLEPHKIKKILKKTESSKSPTII